MKKARADNLVISTLMAEKDPYVSHEQPAAATSKGEDGKLDWPALAICQKL